MDITLSFDKEFDSLMESLRKKYDPIFFEKEGIGSQLDIVNFSKAYFSTSKVADVSIDPNANVQDRSVISYNSELLKPFSKLNSYYMLWKKMKKLFGSENAARAVEGQVIGDHYINDMHGISAGMPYCFNYSTYDILVKGLPMVDKITSLPPKNLYSFKSQLEQFTVIASNSTLGATGLADIFITMSYYFKKILNSGADAGFVFDGWFSDAEKVEISPEIIAIQMDDTIEEQEKSAKIDALVKAYNKKIGKTEPCHKEFFRWNVEKYIKENIVSFIYTVNQPMRSNQSPFTNISIYDKFFLQDLIANYVFPDGSVPEPELVSVIQKIYLDVMWEEQKRTPITFPVATACISKDEDNNVQDMDFLRMCCKYDLSTGFINMYSGESSTLSSCCRLRSSVKSEFFNSYGAGTTKIGSLGVVTQNLARLSKKHDYEGFYKALREQVELAGMINHAKRMIVQERIDGGRAALYSFGFCDIKKQYSTVGTGGMFECVTNLGFDPMSDEGVAEMAKIYTFINDVNDELQQKYGFPHNCEQVPGENSLVKLAEKDKLLGYNEDIDFYSNQFVPLIYDANVLDRIRIQGQLDKYLSGGSVLHLNIEEKIEDPEKLVELFVYCIKMGVIYCSLNYVVVKCVNGHMDVGSRECDICAICGADIAQKYQKVVGFLTPIDVWNKTRREKDFPNRKFYKKKEAQV